MNEELTVKNFSGVKVNARLLRKIVRFILIDVLKENAYSLGIFIVKPAKIAEINKEFLNHEGPTDVISFDHSKLDPVLGGEDELEDSKLYGEIYVCPQVAFEQAKKFRATWSEEFARYVIHGILHIKGYDDLNSQNRKIMRREENRILKKIESKFKIEELLNQS